MSQNKLDALNEELKKKSLLGYWMIPDRSVGYREPQPKFEPYLWKWGELYESLQKAAEFIRPEEAFRRFVGFQHPQLPMGTAHTLLMGAQLVRPGEFAPAHRHMMEAIRFVVKGQGASTIIEGESFPMEEGDLITTPNWSWHDHINAGDSPVIWLDGANGPMIQYYQVGFSEPYSQPQQPRSRPVGWSKQAYGALRSGERTSRQSTFRSPYRYPWAETEKTLEALAESPGDPFDGVLLCYTDPITSAATLPTMSCEIQLLRPGERGRFHRHTHTAVYHGFRGQGILHVGDQRLEWNKGDSFVVPLWNWHAHENKSKKPAILFSINDRPAMESLGLYREEVRD
jgi:gentisate 1,2-dioxygenase